MTNKDKIAELKATAQELQRQIDELESKPEINYWQPKGDEEYWYMRKYGDICNNRSCDGSKRYRVFKTKEEAEKYAEYVKAEETLREAIAIANDGWLPDWDIYEDTKYFISIHFMSNKLILEHEEHTKYQPNFMYIKSQELAEKLMKEYEQEFRIYLSY